MSGIFTLGSEEWDLRLSFIIQTPLFCINKLSFVIHRPLIPIKNGCLIPISEDFVPYLKEKNHTIVFTDVFSGLAWKVKDEDFENKENGIFGLTLLHEIVKDDNEWEKVIKPFEEEWKEFTLLDEIVKDGKKL